MTQTELIKAEIERLQNSITEGEITSGRYMLNKVLSFINSLPEKPKFKVGDIVVSTKNPHLTYKVLQVGLLNELGKLEYEVEIFTDGKAGIQVGNTFKEHNIHLISCDKMDEWGKLITEEPVSKDLEEAAEKYADKHPTCGLAAASFKAGAQWQKEKAKKEVEGIIDGLMKNCPTYDAFGTEEECIVDAQIEALKLVIND